MHTEEGPVTPRPGERERDQVGDDDPRSDAFGRLDADAGLVLLTAALVELPAATLLVYDRDLRYRLVRGGALPSPDRTPASMEGELVCDALGPERWRLYESPYRAALDGAHSTFEVRSPDSAHAFSINVAPLHGRSGEIIGGVSIAVDVTDKVGVEGELRTSEAHFRLLAEHASDVVLQTARGGEVTWVSPSVERLLGWSVAELVGSSAAELIVPADLDHVRRAIDGHEAARGPLELTCRVRSKVGEERWMAARVSRTSSDTPGDLSYVVALRDVSDEVEARADRDARAAELQVIVDSSPDVILRLDTDLRITFVNASARAVHPASAEWIGKSFLDIGLPEEAIPRWESELRASLASGELRTFEIQGREELGRPWWDVRIAPSCSAEGTINHLTLIVRDITERKRAERELFMAATHDPLTGLANRAEVLSEIERALSAATRSSHATAVLMLDLDHFKLVNDSLGHPVGDKLLLAAAQRLSALVRSGDMAGRLGGDEFVVVMRDLDDPTEAARVGDRVVEAFREPLSVGDLALLTTASVGLTVAGPLGAEAPVAATLLREADTALYRAKASGRDALAFFSEDLRAEVAERLIVEQALRHALEREELELWYQPEVDLGSGQIEAVEALLRWRHPSGEVYAAERFIAIAEDTGLIVEIGDWVIRQACHDAARWARRRPDPPLTVRINLSAAQLSELGLVDELRGAIDASGVDPTVLCLEVTEAALLHDLPTAQEKLQAVRALGIGVAVDAFGTGDSSIRCLRECEIDVIKIDAGLADGLGDGADPRLVAGVLALARTMGLPVTAKGIETAGQADALRSLGCGSAQGWLFSRAVAPAGIDELLDAPTDGTAERRPEG
jgi:diguanylate cyclase (GGDEF)-like protein/PAS domain S-box-containing protein